MLARTEAQRVYCAAKECHNDRTRNTLLFHMFTLVVGDT